MTKAQIQQKIARLESINDMIGTELQQIDTMMRQIGFSNGLETVKLTAQDIIERSLKKEKDHI